MYHRVTTGVRTRGRGAGDFSITRGLHQRSTLSLYLCTLVLNVLTEHIHEPMPRCVIFVSAIVLIGELRENKWAVRAVETSFKSTWFAFSYKKDRVYEM